MRILIINGPNLHLLGTREPEVYGTATLADLEEQWKSRAGLVGATVEPFQSNHEGSIIDVISNAAGDFDGIVLNAGALTHYSYAIRDAVSAVGLPTVEVHISNIYEREQWRHTSVLTEVCDTTIVGRGTNGYLNAIDHLVALLSMPPDVIPYGDSGDNVLDLRTPAGLGPHPVALLIHGGFWRDIWKRDLMDPMAVDLARRGWATVNIEYHRGYESYSTAPSDVRSAVAWIREHAVEHDLDRERIVAIGHSAGGYLALQLAHDDTPIAGVLPLAGISNLLAISESRPEDDPVAAFLGASHQEAPRLWTQAELSGHPNTPVHLVHGLNDDTVEPSLSESYLRLTGGAARSTIIPDCGHMELVDPFAACWPSVIAALEGLTR